MFSLFSGKFSVVKECKEKSTGKKFAAKIVKYDSDTVKFALREYELMTNEKFVNLPGTVKLHDAFVVQKYLVLIMDL